MIQTKRMLSNESMFAREIIKNMQSVRHKSNWTVVNDYTKLIKKERNNFIIEHLF